MKANIKVVLVGNPNTGKSTLFNLLTGLNQKVGNFPGVTVDKRSGSCRLADGRTADIVDLPGTYSLFPKSKDESIVFDVISDPKNADHPDVVVLIADATNLKRNLLLYTQVADLGVPVVIALNMIDLADKNGLKIDIDKLALRLGVQIIPIAARYKKGINELKQAIVHTGKIPTQNPTIALHEIAPGIIEDVKAEFELTNNYYALHIAHQHEGMGRFTETQHARIEDIELKHAFHSQKIQTEETIARYNYISGILDEVVSTEPNTPKETLNGKLDAILTHKVWGFLIFILILFSIFNAIFSWSKYPMGLIESSFAWLGTMGHQYLPAGVFTDMLVDGVLAGLSGVFVFVPQIAILFAFIAILEDTGYMARVTFMMDKIMRRFGLNGKSVVPLIGGMACAVPSIMSTRNIESWKDRIITILVTPLVSCSARLPVYTLLIALVVPNERVWGLISLQALALMGMYVIGMLAAVLVAWAMKFIIKSRDRGYFIMELPVYRMPRWSNVAFTMYDRSKTFVVEAGKVIVAVSVVLWVMASYGPPGRFAEIEKQYQDKTYVAQLPAGSNVNKLISTDKLENSYAGILGHVIEPVIKPLGFDWKIGIALITSFAAREAFVGTMATIYSVDGDVDHISTIREKMAEAKDPDTGKPVFTFATAFSLMLFYAFAMQCMSTLATVYRETKSWKWPIIQFAYMTTLAYVASLIAFQFLK